MMISGLRTRFMFRRLQNAAQPAFTRSRNVRRCVRFAGRVVLQATLLSFALPSALLACPFCLSPGQTWSEIVADAGVIALARLVSVSEGENGQPPFSIFEIHEIHKGAEIAPKTRIIRYDDFVFGAKGDLFLLRGGLAQPNAVRLDETFASEDDPQETPPSGVRLASAEKTAADDRPSVFEWDLTQKVSDFTYRYIIEAPAPTSDAQQRLAYHHRFLEHADPLIAADAWGEFARCDYAQIKEFRPRLQAEPLRRWIAAKDISPERLGLYGMLLGLCGEPSDVEFLKQQIGPPGTEDLRFGVEGLMGGLLLLEKETGLSFLSKTRLQNLNASTLDCFATVQALQFVWEYEPELIPRRELRSAMHPMLERPELREIAIRDLARWEDWTIVPRLPGLYKEARQNDIGTCRAIAGFLLTCRKNTPDDDPLHVAAVRILDDIRKDNSRIVRMAEEEQGLRP